MKTRRLIFLLLPFLIILFGICGYFKFVKSPSSKQETRLINDYPIWLLRDGKVSVYRETEVSDKGIAKKIIVKGAKDQGEVTIVEVIPKEIAQKASDVTFNVAPTEVLQDDPVILWKTTKSIDELTFGWQVDPKTKKNVYRKTPEEYCDQEMGYHPLDQEGVIAKCHLSRGIFSWVDTIRADLGNQERGAALQCQLEEGKKLSAWADCFRSYREKIFTEVRQAEQEAEAARQVEQNKKEKISEVVQPGTKKYNEVQQIVRKTPTPTPKKSNSAKISKEEALAKLQASQYKSELAAASYYGGKAAECVPAWSNEDNAYRIVCNRQNYYNENPPGKYATFYEFNYLFYLVTQDGNVYKKGNYVKQRDYQGKEQILGNPMWGVL